MPTLIDPTPDKNISKSESRINIYRLLSDTNYYQLLVKIIGINSENLDGAKRTRTADPLHAMQVLYQLSYGPKS